MNEIVKYSNELHELKFNALTETQQNVLFTLLQQFRNTKDYTLELDFNKIFELANIPRNTDFRLETLKNLGKLQQFLFMFQINELGDLQQDVIFPSIRTDTNNKKIYVKVSKGFKDRYIDSPLKGFTRYELAEFVNLSGTYAKTIYRYLKQYRQTGLWRIRYKDFKELLGIPDSYRATNIDQQILKPTIKELSSERNLFDQRRTPFKGLMIKKIKSGKSIEALEFYFEPQPVSEIDADPENNRRNLATIAEDLHRQSALKAIKKSSGKATKKPSPKINPLTGQVADELAPYFGRYLRIYNDKFKAYDVLKIVKIEQSGEQLEVHLRNADDEYQTLMRFDTIKHFLNTFERYGD